MVDIVAYSKLKVMAIAAEGSLPTVTWALREVDISMLAACRDTLHAPKLVVFFQTRGIDPSLDELPLAVADPRVMAGASMNSGLIESFPFFPARD